MKWSDFLEEQTKKIVEFMEHVESDVELMHDEFETNHLNGDYDNKHDIIVEVNGKSLQIEMCAEVYHAFISFLNFVKEESEQ